MTIEVSVSSVSCSFVTGVDPIQKDRVPSMNMYLVLDTAIYSSEEHFNILFLISIQAIISS